MTLPTVAATSQGTTFSTSSGTSHVLTLPSGSGGILIATLVYDSTDTSLTSFTGWTGLGSTYVGTSPDAHIDVWYRVATGSDPVTVITATPNRVSYIIRRVSSYQGVPVLGTWDVNSGGGIGSTTTDPPSLTSGFGNVDQLWLAVMCHGGGTRTVTGYPSGYSGGVNEFGLGTSADHGVANAYLTSSVGTENPGVFTTSSTSWQSGAVLALQGADDLVADFDASPTTGALPLTVTFMDTSHGGVGTINAWLWDFGDGSTSTSQNPTHIYTVAGFYSVTLTVTNSAAQTDDVTQTELINAGSTYTPPSPSNAVIEIRAAAVGSARWGTAHWGEDVWSSAGWVDVTPQSVDATVRWGSHSPEAGVLTEMEPASWIVDTYDPDRLLDPGNPDGPYVTDLRAGLPIRIRHRGTIVRQGIAEQILFQHKDSVGGIRVTDNVSLMARSPVPADTTLSDTLRARARDVIAAAGLSVTVEPDPPSGDPALAPRLEDVRSVWRHVADAAQQVLHVPFLDNVGVLHFRAWASPYDRARGVDSTELVDLGTLVSTRGLYSVVQAQQTIGDGDALIERRLTPTPRYGSVTYSRTDATPDAEDWAAAVLADRSLQTVQWIPGAIYPLTADDVEYLATLETMERFGVEFVEAEPPIDITGIIVGGEFRVTSKKESEAIWSFELELAQTADSPLYTDTDPPEFLLNEAGDGYLYPD